MDHQLFRPCAPVECSKVYTNTNGNSKWFHQSTVTDLTLPLHTRQLSVVKQKERERNLSPCFFDQFHEKCTKFRLSTEILSTKFLITSSDFLLVVC